MFIANFFEQSLKELCERHKQLEYSFKSIDSNHFTVTIYDNGENVAQCKIWLSSDRHFGDICYSIDVSSSDNSMNDALSIDDDGYSIYFNPSSFAVSNYQHRNEQVTKRGAAEYFWSNLIAPLQ